MKTIFFQHLRSALQNMAQGLLEGRAALQSANARAGAARDRAHAGPAPERAADLLILKTRPRCICRFDAGNRMTFS